MPIISSSLDPTNNPRVLTTLTLHNSNSMYVITRYIHTYLKTYLLLLLLLLLLLIM